MFGFLRMSTAVPGSFDPSQIRPRIALPGQLPGLQIPSIPGNIPTRFQLYTTCFIKSKQPNLVDHMVGYSITSSSSSSRN